MEIIAEQISKSYGRQKALDEVSFRVRPGRVTAFLGPNGAGKTTAMRILSGYLVPDSGRVSIGGTDVCESPAEAQRHIGYLPGDNPLWPELSISGHLDLAARLQGMHGKEKRRQIENMMGLCGLYSEAHKNAGELSKGYRQRLGLALALVHQPRVLILDEATTGLDPNQISEIQGLISEMGKDSTLLLSTHQLHEATKICEDLLIINHGRIVAAGPAKELLHGHDDLESLFSHLTKDHAP